MEAKLIKNPEGYDTPYILTNMEDNLIASTEGKLSLKNCQAIELGYDLDELAKECAETAHTMDELYENGLFYGFMSGFQKALEILGDKKFSEDDVISMIEKSRETGLTAEYLILTKQQTEFDVEIVMECDGIETGLCDESCTCNVFPKLDADGCLILKRK